MKLTSTDTLRHFTKGEPGLEDWEEMDRIFMEGIDEARDIAGFPFHITSGFREGDKGAHGRGLAVDIKAPGNWERMEIVKALLEVGTPRIGVYDLHVHADMDSRLPPGMWGGISK